MMFRVYSSSCHTEYRVCHFLSNKYPKPFIILNLLLFIKKMPVSLNKVGKNVSLFLLF